LQYRTNNHDRRTKEDHFPSTENVSDENSDDCTNETADIVTGNWDTLDGCNVVVAWIIHGLKHRTISIALRGSLELRQCLLSSLVSRYVYEVDSSQDEEENREPHINLWKLSNPASKGQKSTHHTLVIAE